MQIAKCYDACMRTTVTLDDDVVKLLRDMAHRQNRSFKAVINDALRASLGKNVIVRRKKISLPAYSMANAPASIILKPTCWPATLKTWTSSARWSWVNDNPGP